MIGFAASGYRIAWLLLATGVVGGNIMVLQRAGAYLEYVRGAALGNVLLALSALLAPPGTAGLAILLPLLFPDGRLPSAHWRPVLWLFVGATMLSLLGSLGTEQLIALGLPNVYRVDSAVLRAAYPVSMALYIVATGAAVASLVHRYRTADPTTRLQIRWVAYAAAVFGTLVIGLVAFGLTYDATGLSILSVAHALLPLAVTIAILRYRLYDIDVLINRTLVYGALSAVLGATYFLAVLAFETVLRPLTAGSEVAVALSTLAVVALFAPLRRGIQRFVDRRFYRSRYDAARTLDAFSVHLRDEVDLDAVRDDLVDAVERTMQPAHASLWLRR